MIRIQRHNVDSILDSDLLYAKMKNGRWWRLRRNGATKRWKRDALRIKVPVKYGMYGYGALEERDFGPCMGDCLSHDSFRHADDVPAEDKAS